MSGWQPIASRPTEFGAQFLTRQDDEIYHTKVCDYGRLAFRTHDLWEPEEHRVVDAVMNGKPVKARALVKKGLETFHHQWTLWTQGFEFKPTEWAPLPSSDLTSRE